MAPSQANFIQQLADERDIRNLIYLYCRAVDRCDEALLRSLYHEDAYEVHGAYVGPAEGYFRYALDTMAWMQSGSHQITNILMEVEGHVAQVESCFLAVSGNATDPDGVKIDLLMTGRYLDRFERRSGAWKIAHRRVVFDTNHTLPASGKWTGALYGNFHPRGQKNKTDPLYSPEAPKR